MRFRFAFQWQSEYNYSIRKSIANKRSRCSAARNKKVTLMFDPDILSEIFDRFGDGVRVVEQSEKLYSAEVKVQVSKPFFAWIVGSVVR